jgi:hypothetical protein
MLLKSKKVPKYRQHIGKMVKMVKNVKNITRNLLILIAFNGFND